LDINLDDDKGDDWGEDWDDATDLFKGKKETPREVVCIAVKKGSPKRSITSSPPKRGASDEDEDEFHSADDGEEMSEEGEAEEDLKEDKKPEKDVNQVDNEKISSPTAHISDDKYPSEKDIEREGAIAPFNNLRMIESNYLLYVPETQDEELFTEDMLLEQMEKMSKLGGSSTDNSHHHQLQSRSLFSDMQAFKAANPTCILEDFVRWHSPKDWIVSDVGNNRKGVLSDRMASKDNIWHQLWRDAAPLPAKRQPLIFDFQTEAQRALDYLDSIKPLPLFKELLKIASSTLLFYLCNARTPAKDLPFIRDFIKDIKVAIKSYANENNESSLPNNNSRSWESIRDIAGDLEQLLTRGTTLLSKLPNQMELVNQLLGEDGQQCIIKNDKEGRMSLLNLIRLNSTDDTGGEMVDTTLSSLIIPESREYILKCKSSRSWGAPFNYLGEG
jgi:hypothetical protein